MGTTVIIASSSDLPGRYQNDAVDKLDTLLSSLSDFEVIAVNDRNGFIARYCEERSLKATSSNAKSRSGFKQVVANASHLVLVWGGYDLHELIFFASLKKIPVKIIPFLLTKVVNRDRNEEFDIYIGRGTAWGNPFPIDHGSDVGRAHVIERYKEYFYTEVLADPIKKQLLHTLKGLRLGCHCKPLACHGDIIVDYLNGLADESPNEK